MSSVENPLDLTGCSILVTGASSGIGRETSITLSRLGARVICTGRNQDRLHETLQKLAKGDHAAAAFDLSETGQIGEWVKAVVTNHGQLYGVVHAAGVQSSSPISRIRAEQWSKLASANIDAAIALIKAFQAPENYAGPEGRIVLISSVLARAGSPGRSAYAATKGALEGLTPSLALELAPRGIRVNCVAPAFVQTPMYEDMRRFWTADQFAEIEAQHPLGIGTPDDIAYAVAYLLAKTGRWITGTVLTVDGGYLAR